MRQNKHFADVLGEFVARIRRTARQISKMSAERFGEHHGVPHATISRWLRGETKKPRAWQDLMKLAIVLKLSESEADELFKSAKHPPLATWRETVSSDADKELLSYWDKRDKSETVVVPLATPSLRPFQVPRELSYFTGRKTELNTLKELLQNNQPFLCLIGMGGVGKTTLAIHLANQLRDKFPDGVLWSQLECSDTMSVLRSFADAYGHDVSQYSDLGSRSSKVRELLANKRALIVLDNAERDEQVRPLLPPSGSCAVIITTRYHDLSVADSAHCFHIKPFSRQNKEGLSLFAQILGTERAQREQEALSEMADLLGHLPLAIALAANRMKRGVGWSATHFLRRIRQEKRRLTELVRGDQGVRLSFSFSYRALPAHLQHVFATLGVFAGEDFTVAAAAYVAALSTEQAEDYLRELYNLSLLQQGRIKGEQIRYKLHPLLRDYSREKLNEARSMPPVTLDEIMLGTPILQAARESQGAVLLDSAGLLATAQDEATGPAEADVWERMVTFFVHYLVTHEHDYAALDIELDNLFAALDVAFERHLSASLIRGATVFYAFLQARGLYQQAKLHLTRAEQVAKQSGDFWHLATIWRHLGHIAYKQGEYVEAKKRYQKALSLARQTRNLPQISALLTSLGVLAYRQGAFREAKQYYQEAMTLARQARDKPRIATLLTNLALITAELGDYEEAESSYRQALQLARKMGNKKRLICTLLQNLGHLMYDREQYEPARTHFQEGLTLANEMGDPELRSRMLGNLGLVVCALGNHAEAANLFRQGLTLAEKSGLSLQICRQLANLGVVATAQQHYDAANYYYQRALALGRQNQFPLDMCIMLNQWGECHLAQQKLDEASERFQEALKIARQAQNLPEAAKSYYGLARIAAKRGDIELALELGQQSQLTFATIGHKKTNLVMRWLAEIG